MGEQPESRDAPYYAIVEQVATNLGVSVESVHAVMDEYERISAAEARKRREQGRSNPVVRRYLEGKSGS